MIASFYTGIVLPVNFSSDYIIISGAVWGVDIKTQTCPDHVRTEGFAGRRFRRVYSSSSKFNLFSYWLSSKPTSSRGHIVEYNWSISHDFQRPYQLQVHVCICCLCFGGSLLMKRLGCLCRLTDARMICQPALLFWSAGCQWDSWLLAFFYCRIILLILSRLCVHASGRCAVCPHCFRAIPGSAVCCISSNLREPFIDKT